MAEQEAGYQIGKRFFPFPTSFRMLDAVLIRDLTGMNWDEFLGAMPDEDDPEAIGDPIVMAGMLGVAVWQQNPMWRRDKVVRFVQGVNIEEVEAVGLSDETAAEEGEEVPLEPTNGSKDSEKSVLASVPALDSPSEPSSPKLSGTPESVGTQKEQ